jgi:putative tryptophan/tyrosine transport system substrate-binding protein
MPGNTNQFAVLQDAAKRQKIELVPHIAGTLEQMRAAVTSLKGQVGGVVFIPQPLMFFERVAIARMVNDAALPAIDTGREYVPAGGLVGYGPDNAFQHRLAARYVDKLLKGADPANLPVETPTHYVLSINLRTAKRLGVTVPPSILVRADDVVEND